MHDFIVIGGGTAGLSAAVYACRANKKTLVIERESFGGQITAAPVVENYPGIGSISGAQFASDLFDQAEAQGAQFVYENVTAIEKGRTFKVKTDGGEYEARAVIIAAGCEHKKLGAVGEDKLIGSGVSYCALCDGAFFKDKTVGVVGGGNAAFAAATYLKDIARTVYLIHRRSAYRAEPTTVDKLRRIARVRFLPNSRVTEMIGGECLKGVKLDINGLTRTLALDGLFIAIGQQPDNGAFGVALDGDGYILADEQCRTDVKGIYAIGDCRKKTVRQLTTAAADGAIAVATALGEMF